MICWKDFGEGGCQLASGQPASDPASWQNILLLSIARTNESTREHWRALDCGLASSPCSASCTVTLAHKAAPEVEG